MTAPTTIPGTAALPRHLRHRGIADRELRTLAQDCGESLGVATRGADIELEAVLFEYSGVLADIEIDVTQVVNGFDEVDSPSAPPPLPAASSSPGKRLRPCSQARTASHDRPDRCGELL